MPFLSVLIPLLPYLIGGVAIFATIAVHDYRVRSAEAAKWAPKLTACEGNVKLATDANLSLKADYDAFALRHDQMIKGLAEQQRIALERKNKALIALGLREHEAQAALDDLRRQAAAPPQPTKEGSCEQATATLRALAVERLRDAAPDQ